MNYTIEWKEAFQILGVSRAFHTPESMKEIPAFWDEYYQNDYGKIACGQFAYCFDEKKDGHFRYAIGNFCTKDEDGTLHIFNCPDQKSIPEGFELLTIPAQMWMKAESLGPLPQSIQGSYAVIRKEWPGDLERISGFELEEYGICVLPEDSQKTDYRCFIWIPVRIKEDSPLLKKPMFRCAMPGDVDTILGFIRDLAEYEKMSNEVVAEPESIQKWMFVRKTVEAQLVFVGGKAVGFAMYFYNFSTWLGKAGIYIEDVYVRPEFRKQGIGRQFFQRIARKALSENCGRVEWWCLKWNKPSLDFYQSIGAIQMEEWMPLRLTGTALTKLAAEE